MSTPCVYWIVLMDWCTRECWFRTYSKGILVVCAACLAYCCLWGIFLASRPRPPPESFFSVVAFVPAVCTVCVAVVLSQSEDVDGWYRLLAGGGVEKEGGGAVGRHSCFVSGVCLPSSHEGFLCSRCDARYLFLSHPVVSSTYPPTRVR